MTFYKCTHCGNIIAYIHDAGVRCICCGEKMQPLVPNTSDGAGEKHVPVISMDVTSSGSCWKLPKAGRENP